MCSQRPECGRGPRVLCVRSFWIPCTVSFLSLKRHDGGNTSTFFPPFETCEERAPGRIDQHLLDTLSELRGKTVAVDVKKIFMKFACTPRRLKEDKQ